MHHLTTKHFPFTALVGQERMKTALLLNAINPLIGGVLIRGAKGTGKSTAARALAEVLPEIEVVEDCPYHCHPRDTRMMCDACIARHDRGEELPVRSHGVPFVTLPLGATEDRVAGTIDVAEALASGRARLRPGLLAEAHRGILYVDEVNLLDDHLVDLLLDAAAMGRNVVEREGISAVHPARFILIGTMNPEEGELRPQLLDRFGIAVEVETLADVDQRVAIMELQEEYDRDAEAMVARFGDSQQAERERIRAAMAGLPRVAVDRAAREGAARRALEAHVDGHRADVAMVRVATTLAALQGDAALNPHHLDEAAPYVLAHRLRRRPFERPPAPEPSPERTPQDGEQEPQGEEGRATPEEPSPHPLEVEAVLPEAHARGRRQGRGAAGERGTRGKKLGSRRPAGDDEPLDVSATLLAAATREGPDRARPAPAVTDEDLRSPRTAARARRLICFVVDASGSMGAHQRLEAVRRASRQLLEQSYQGRHQVSLIVARGDRAEVVASLSRDLEGVDERIRAAEPGGRTPLAHALQLADRELRLAADRGLAPALVLLTDGRANVPLPGGDDPVADTLGAAAEVAERGADALVVDTENDFVDLGLGRDLAEELGADHLRTADPAHDAILGWLRERG